MSETSAGETGGASVEKVQMQVNEGATELQASGTRLGGEAQNASYPIQDAMHGAAGSIESERLHLTEAERLEAEAAAKAAEAEAARAEAEAQTAAAAAAKDKEGNGGEENEAAAAAAQAKAAAAEEASAAAAAGAQIQRMIAGQHRETANGLLADAHSRVSAFIQRALFERDGAFETARGMIGGAFAGSHNPSVGETVMNDLAKIPEMISGIINTINGILDTIKTTIAPETARQGGDLFVTSAQQARDEVGNRMINVGFAAVAAAAML